MGLVGLALCRDATGKGPACPGLECCTEKERRKDRRKKITGRKEGKDNDRKEKGIKKSNGRQKGGQKQ